MSTDLNQRIALLEASQRRWMLLAIISWCVFAVVVPICVGVATVSYLGYRHVQATQIERIQQYLPDR
jgi:hypothetical protein